MNTPQLVRIWIDDAWRVALHVKTGHKFAHVIPMDAAGLRVRTLPADDIDHFQPLESPTLNQAKRGFRRAARRFGITRAAKHHLKG